MPPRQDESYLDPALRGVNYNALQQVQYHPPAAHYGQPTLIQHTHQGHNYPGLPDRNPLSSYITQYPGQSQQQSISQPYDEFSLDLQLPYSPIPDYAGLGNEALAYQTPDALLGSVIDINATMTQAGMPQLPAETALAGTNHAITNMNDSPVTRIPNHSAMPPLSGVVYTAFDSQYMPPAAYPLLAQPSAHSDQASVPAQSRKRKRAADDANSPSNLAPQQVYTNKTYQPVDSNSSALGLDHIYSHGQFLHSPPSISKFRSGMVPFDTLIDSPANEVATTKRRGRKSRSKQPQTDDETVYKKICVDCPTGDMTNRKSGKFETSDRQQAELRAEFLGSQDRCKRCRDKFIRQNAPNANFTLDPAVADYQTARALIFAPQTAKAESKEGLEEVKANEDEIIQGFIDAVNEAQNEPRKEETQSDGKSEPDWPSDQQKTLNGRCVMDKDGRYSNAMVTARMRMLFACIVEFHEGSRESHLPWSGDSSGYKDDTRSTVIQRVELISTGLRIDKRIVLDVLENRGVRAFVANPVAYHDRKTSNDTCNRKKARVMKTGNAALHADDPPATRPKRQKRNTKSLREEKAAARILPQSAPQVHQGFDQPESEYYDEPDADDSDPAWGP